MRKENDTGRTCDSTQKLHNLQVESALASNLFLLETIIQLGEHMFLNKLFMRSK